MLNSAQQNVEEKKPTLLFLFGASINNLKQGFLNTSKETRYNIGGYFYSLILVVITLVFLAATRL